MDENADDNAKWLGEIVKPGEDEHFTHLTIDEYDPLLEFLKERTTRLLSRQRPHLIATELPLV